MTKQICVSNNVYERLTGIKDGMTYGELIECLMAGYTPDTMPERINAFMSGFDAVYADYPVGSPSVLKTQLRDALHKSCLSGANANALSNKLYEYLVRDIPEE